MTTPLQHQDEFLDFKRRMAALQIEVGKVCDEVNKTEQPRGSASFKDLSSRLFEHWNRYIDHLGYTADRCLDDNAFTETA